MLVDANILLFAVDESSPFHSAAAGWLSRQLDGNRRVGFPWPVLGAFLRISTNPRAAEHPLSPEQAWSHVDDWLATEVAWIPLPTERHTDVFRSLVLTHQLRGNLIADAHLAALALEHGLAIASADSDFARFPEVRWENPLQPR